MESQMQQILSKARTLIEAKRYEDARALLITVDHPTAEKWLAKLNQIIASAQTPAVGSPPLQPIASARLSSQEATPMHSGNSSAQPAYYQPLTQSFTGKFVATIVLFFILILPGLIALSIFSREAEEAQKRSQVPISWRTGTDRPEAQSVHSDRVGAARPDRFWTPPGGKCVYSVLRPALA